MRVACASRGGGLDPLPLHLQRLVSREVADDHRGGPGAATSPLRPAARAVGAAAAAAVGAAWCLGMVRQRVAVIEGHPPEPALEPRAAAAPVVRPRVRAVGVGEWP